MTTSNLGGWRKGLFSLQFLVTIHLSGDVKELEASRLCHKHSQEHRELNRCTPVPSVTSLLSYSSRLKPRGWCCPQWTGSSLIGMLMDQPDLDSPS